MSLHEAFNTPYCSSASYSPPLCVVFVFFKLGAGSFNKYDLNFILSSVSVLVWLKSAECEVVYTSEGGPRNYGKTPLCAVPIEEQNETFLSVITSVVM